MTLTLTRFSSSFLLIVSLLISGSQALTLSHPKQHLNIEAEFATLEQLLQQRLGLMKEVAAWKYANGKSALDTSREQQLLDFLQQQATEYGLEPDPVLDFFRIQFSMSRDIQIFWHNQWKLSGSSGESYRDLNRIIRPRITKLTGEIVKQLYILAPYLQAQASQPNAIARVIKLGSTMSSLASYPVSIYSIYRLQTSLFKVHTIKNQEFRAYDRITKSGFIKIGTTGDYPPFTHFTNNRYQGVDIEIAKKIARDLRVQLKIVKTSWPNLMSGLKAGFYDIAVGGVSINEERLSRAFFSNPHHSGGKAAVGLCSFGNENMLLSDLDRPNYTVAVNPGGTNQKFVNTHIKQATVTVVDDNLEIFNILNEGKADFMITDRVEILVQKNSYPNLCQLSSGTFNTNHKGIMLVRDDRLRQEVNNTLERMGRSGELQELFKRYIDSP